jgi:osmotically-inducible protein OsmY
MTCQSFKYTASLKLAIASTLLLSPCLGGCALAVVGGVAAAGGAGYEAAQERGVNGTYNDMNLTATINNQLNNRYGNITTTVYDHKVLLTGSSPTPQARAQAEQIARQTPGAGTLYDEIQVAPVEDAGGLATDAWISARVRSDMVFDTDIRSGNYTIETDRGSVYLLGSARSPAELDKATQHARYVPGVQRVVSYVDIRYGEPNGMPPATAQAAPPPPPPMASSGGVSSYAPPSASNAPIQVQKLN